MLGQMWEVRSEVHHQRGIFGCTFVHMADYRVGAAALTAAELVAQIRVKFFTRPELEGATVWTARMRVRIIKGANAGDESEDFKAAPLSGNGQNFLHSLTPVLQLKGTGADGLPLSRFMWPMHNIGPLAAQLTPAIPAYGTGPAFEQTGAVALIRGWPHFAGAGITYRYVIYSPTRDTYGPVSSIAIRRLIGMQKRRRLEGFIVRNGVVSTPADPDPAEIV